MTEPNDPAGGPAAGGAEPNSLAQESQPNTLAQSPTPAPDDHVALPNLPPTGDAPRSAPRSGRVRTIAVVVVLFAVLGVIAFAVRNQTDANDLKVGACFNVPQEETIQTVEQHPCTEPHDAEVILVTTYTGSDSTYPILLTFDDYAQSQCTPAFESYTGQKYDDTTDLDIGYLYPSSDAWDNGNRTFTCYAQKHDGSKLTQSIKAAGQ